MKLDDFIYGALTDIIKGVHMAQQRAPDLKAVVNPFAKGRGGEGDYLIGPDGAALMVRDVAFDVAVTVEQGKAKEAEGVISVVGGLIGIGGKTKTSKQDITVSRLQFQVRVALPGQQWDSDKMKEWAKKE